jgi:adenosine/AMP kinase
VVEVRQRPDGDCDVAVDGSLLERVAVEVVLAETPHGRAILGVVDGASPLGVETAEDVAARRDLLRKIGYKL